MANVGIAGHLPISVWLGAGEPQEFENGARVQPITELQRPENLLTMLTEELRDARIPPDFVHECAEVLGVDHTLESVQRLAPTIPTMRLGYFGEVLAACCLRDFDGCRIAISKQQFAIAPNQSLPGTDVLAAVVVDGRIEAMIFAEAKVRTTRDRGVVAQASRQAISDAEDRHPTIVGFVLRQLWGSQDPMFRPFLNYFQRRNRGTADDRPYVYLVLEQGNWSDNDVTRLDDLSPLPPGFRITVVEIANLKQLVDQLYAWNGMVADDDGE